MKLSREEVNLLRALSGLANKLLSGNGKAVPVSGRATNAARKRTFRSREESAKLKAQILAAYKKGRPVAEISDAMGVTSPYVYQLISKQKRAK
ncbi:MAG: helix-turn-helix domain-containing protein [Parvibaculaceae bacterium]|jgi:hypothetical protein